MAILEDVFRISTDASKWSVCVDCNQVVTSEILMASEMPSCPIEVSKIPISRLGGDGDGDDGGRDDGGEDDVDEDDGEEDGGDGGEDVTKRTMQTS